MVKREKANYMIQSVSHAIDVLEELSQVESEIGVTELSKRLKLHKNNVFRLLATLELRGFVEQNMDTEDYRLGVKVLQLGQAFSNQNTLVTRARPILRALSEASGETCGLVTLQNGNVQFPLSIDSKKPVKVAARSAVSFSAKQSAAGRLLMANLPDAVLNELLATNTPQDAAIRGQLNELRTSGQIADRGVIESDVIAVARAVRGQKNEIVAAIEVLIPQYRAKLESIMPLLDKAAGELSMSLGSSKQTLTATIEKQVSIPAKPATI
jgi:IclR family KDG regulon transcriptional repressor